MKKQWTTVLDFIQHGKVTSKYQIVEVQGMNTVGDGGALTLVRTGAVGTPSQSFTDTGSNTCVDKNGDVWGLQEGAVVAYNGTDDWFGNGFGLQNVGNYQYVNQHWGQAKVQVCLGEYEEGIQITESNQYVTYENGKYFASTLPYTTTGLTPNQDSNLYLGGDLNQGNLGQYTDIVYRESVDNSSITNLIKGIPLEASDGDIVTVSTNGLLIRYTVSTDNLGYGYGTEVLDSGLIANRMSGTMTNTRNTVLMAYYNLPQFGTGEEGLRLAISTDGHEYNSLTNGALANTTLTTPSITYNDGYWWLTGDISADLGFPLYKSKNLYDWELVASNIIPDGLPTFYNIWDVDFVQGSDDVYITFNVNTSTSTLPDESNFYPYLAKADDLHTGTFETASKIVSSELNESSSFIDFNVHHYNGTFVAAVKEEREGSVSLFTLTSTSLTGTWSNRVDVVVSESPVYEAPSLAVMDGVLYMYYDRISGQNLSSKSYLYRTTQDLVTWSDENIIDIDVTNIRHAYTYNVPEGDALASVTSNASLFSKPEAKKKLLLPDSAVFAVGKSITDTVNGLKVDGYSTIQPLGSNVFEGSGKNKGQTIPSGWYKYKTDQVWNGRGTTNLLDQSAYTVASSRVTATDDNGQIKLEVNEQVGFIGLYWDHACTQGESYTFSMVSDKNIASDLQVFDGTASSTVGGLVKESYSNGNYFLSVTWVADNTGSYRVGLSTLASDVGDVIRIDKVQSENNEFPTPYVDYGITRQDGVMLYEANYLDLRGSYVMCKVSSNFSTLNDYIFLGSQRPDGKHTRIRPQSIDNMDVDDMFVFAVFDDDFNIKFGYWATLNNSGSLINQSYYDSTLPESTGFIQLGKPGSMATRRSYEYFIVGTFEGSEFDTDGEVNQQLVREYEEASVVIDQALETAPVPSSSVKRRSDGSIPHPLSAGTITASGTYTPKPNEVLRAVNGVGHVSVTIDGSKLHEGDIFYVLLATNSSSDSITVTTGGDSLMPAGVDYVISAANSNSDAYNTFVKHIGGKIRKVI